MRETHLHPRLRRILRAMALGTCAALLVAGCGDSGGSSSGSDDGSGNGSQTTSDNTDTSLGEGQWIGGPRQGVAELPAADGDDSRAGGASGSW